MVKVSVRSYIFEADRDLRSLLNNAARGNVSVNNFTRGGSDMPRLSPVARGCTFIVAGRVVRVRARRGGGWRVRLTETGGALAAAEIRLSNPMPLPPRSAYIVIRGSVRYDQEHGWYAIDPVESWVPLGVTHATDYSSLFASAHNSGG